jgi:hypothetical protein
LNNLGALLTEEVKAKRASHAVLFEARQVLERALHIRERLAVAEIWTTYGLLAEVAEVEARTEEVERWQKGERESFATFAGNRYHIDQQFGDLITAIVLVAQGAEQMRNEVEEELLLIEKDGWQINAAIQRLWAGERDWHVLAQRVDRQDALVILRVLEMLQQSQQAQEIAGEDLSLEQIATLPTHLKEVIKYGVVFQEALDALASEEASLVANVLQQMLSTTESEDE